MARDRGMSRADSVAGNSAPSNRACSKGKTRVAASVSAACAAVVAVVVLAVTQAGADVLPPTFEIAHVGGSGTGSLFASAFNDTSILFKVCPLVTACIH